ncbi:hypothetical protein I317_00022 [Kwoniella heveanensis CBS 569]|nr:hypothetical protein I317_00022 [Kwoniella heveanensis CBS 569]
MAIMTTHPDGLSNGMAAIQTPAGLFKPYPFFAQPLKPPQVTDGDLVKQLRQTVVGQGGHCYTSSGKQPQVIGRDDEGFTAASTIFNGAVKTHALALVKPTDASDVSRTIIFCREHDLELSVKGGGHGVHGWSVAGHVILDLSLMNDISISLPNPVPPTLQESFERLQLRRDSTSTNGTDRRPSLADSHQGSSESGIKRSAQTLDNGDGNDGTDTDGARRKGRVDGDRADYSPLDRIDEEDKSRSSSAMDGERSGSGSRSGEELKSFNSTPATSVSDQQSPREGSSGISHHQAEAGPSRGPRVTYVNPSQTPTSAFPFVPTTFGASPGASSSSYGSFHPAFGGPSQQLTLNTHPDPPPYTLVSFGAGTHSKELDAFTARSPYGAFHVPTSAFPVGSGQFLSGGFGFLGRKHGMAMDNIVEVEMVLSDGRIVWVGQGGTKGGDWKEGEDPEEVWWAIKGAGAILGVVTRIRAKAYYLPSVYAGNLIYLFDRSSTPSLLRHVRDCIKGSPRTLYTNIIMTAGPPGAPAIVVFQLCFSGSRAEGEMYVQAISAWEGGRSLFQDFSERTFERQQLAVEEVLKGGHGRKWFIKSDMLKSLSDEVIDETCARFHSVPDGCTWLFEYTGGGAVADVKDSCFPQSHRESAFTVAALHQWSHTEPPVEDTRCVTTAEEWINEVIHPNSPGGPLPCFLQSAKQSDVASVYGINYPRLKTLKKLIDPDNFFRHAMWPATYDEKDELQSLPDGEIGAKEAEDAGLTRLLRDGEKEGRVEPSKDKGKSKGE